MTSEFLLPFSQLNLVFLSLYKRDKLVKSYKLVFIKVMKIFKYEKNNDRYLDRVKFDHQVIKKVLPITEVFYYSYGLLFLLNNADNHSVYAKNTF